MSYELTFCLILAGLVFVVYYYFKKQYSYWKDRDIPHVPVDSFLGIIKDLSAGIHLSEITTKIYQGYKSKGPICGFHLFSTPIALITDLDLVKNVLIKDAQHFLNRGFYFNERDDPMSAHLFNLEDKKWKTLRAKLTPTFTSGKMKFMFATVNEIGDRFLQKLNSLVSKTEELEVKDLLARFTTDVIGSCAFGIDCNSLDDPKAKFREIGVLIVKEKRPFRTFLLQAFGNLGRFFRQKFIEPEISEFFTTCVEDTVKYREEHNIRRNDFLDILIGMKNSGGDSSLTLAEIAAQCFVFFLGGFETSSNLMSFCLYELSFYPEIQERLRQHISDILEKHNGVLSYEATMEMKYLDQVLYETLRKYSAITVHSRVVTKDYNVPGTQYTLVKDTKVWIPLDAIHHDPELYPNPHVFDPERFTPENVKQRHIAAWTPFGEGPRVCIGLRFGLMQARIGIVKILQNFRISRSPKTPKVLILDPKTPFTKNSLGGIHLNFEKCY